jgi:hypothetical protein
MGPLIPTSNVLLENELDCEVISETYDLIQYECISEVIEMRYSYTLEGQPASPFVRIISRSSKSR